MKYSFNKQLSNKSCAILSAYLNLVRSGQGYGTKKKKKTDKVSVLVVPGDINIEPTDINILLSSFGKLAVHIDQPLGSFGSSGNANFVVSTLPGLYPLPPNVIGVLSNQ